MKKSKYAFKRGLVCTLIVVSIVFGVLAFSINRETFNSQATETAALSSDPWNGRGSNTIPGTGFSEPSSVGADLSEPLTWTSTHNSRPDFVNSQGNKFDYYDNSTTAKNFTALLADTSASEGNFRKKDYTAAPYVYPTNDIAGKDASHPWVISNVREYIFYTRMIQLTSTNQTNIYIAYAEKPYFALGGNIDLTGYRYEAPRFGYSGNNTLTAGSPYPSGTQYYNRFYFDGAGYSISNAYVNQVDSGNALPFTASASIFGNIPMKSIIRNISVINAFVSVSNPASTNEAAIVAVSGGAECIFDNITVSNSVLRGYRHMNGIAVNASVIRDCKVLDTTFISLLSAANQEIRGVGVAAEFRGNEVKRTNIETSNAGFYTWSIGIGKLRAVPVYNPSNGTGYDRVSNKWTTEDEFTSTAVSTKTQAAGTGIEFLGGFFNNSVEDSQIGTNGGTSYGHAVGIGYVNAAVPSTFEGNTVKNSLISSNTNNDIASTSVYACGIAYISNAEANVQINNNSVLSSTVSVVTKQHTPHAYGMFYITADRGVKISNCYTENTDVMARITGGIGTANAYAAGIAGGYVSAFENCITGSGNIGAHSVGGNVYAYGIGSTLGISATNPGNRKYWTNEDANASNTANLNGWWNFAGDKGDYIGDQPVTYFKNCFNFSNITTSSTITVYAAGIGMGEGFYNCINYGNIIGNYVGGIALGFNDSTSNNNSPGTAAGNTSHRFGYLRPLIIDGCANFGNLIKAANNQTSRIGGIYASYNLSLNYYRTRLVNNGAIDTVENIDGKHCIVTNCISDGRYYFYNSTDGGLTYEIVDQVKNAGNNIYWGHIFGYLNLHAYSFETVNLYNKPVNTAGFIDFITNRFIIENNYFNLSSGFDIMEFTQLPQNRITAIDTTNLSGHDYVINFPASNYRQLNYGVITSTLTPKSEYLNAGGNPAMNGTAAVNVWSAIVLNWVGSMDSYNSYDEIDSTVWDVSSGVPQIENAAYPFQILAYTGNAGEQGYVPNVSIQKFAGSATFTVSEYNNPETGKTVDVWYLYQAPGTPYAPGSLLVSTRADNLTVTMLFAEIIFIEYSIEFDVAAGYTYPPVSNVKKDESVEVSVSTNITGSVTGIIWSVQSKSGDMQVIYTTDIEDEGPGLYENTLSLIITDAFITNYAQDGNIFIFKAEFSSLNMYRVEVILDNIIDPSDEFGIVKLYINGQPYTQNATGLDRVKVMQGSKLTLNAEYDVILYDFVEFDIAGSDGCYTVSNGSITSPYAVIDVEDEITSITFNLSPKQYDITIQQYIFTSGGIKASIDSIELVEYSSEQVACVGAGLTGFGAASFAEDAGNQCFYKFIRWEFANGTQISNIEEINVTPAILKGNLMQVGSENKFVLAVIYQRQVKLVINMENEMEITNNSYVVFQGDNKIEIQDFEGHKGVIVDENALIRVEFYPDSRLAIEKIDGMSVSERKDYINGVLYISLTNFKQLNVFLVPRDATVFLYSHRAHDDDSYNLQGGLRIVTLNNNDTFSLSNIGYNSIFAINLDLLTYSNQYRFINMLIWNVDTLEWVAINHNFKSTPNYTMIADDNFFQYYVDKGGKCQILLVVAVVYEVNISASNFTRQDGTYIYTDKFGNSFTLNFVKDSSAVVVENDANSFIIDHGVIIEYSYNEGFNKFYSINIGESEKEKEEIEITSTRQIAFLPKQFNLNVEQIGESNASIDGFNKTFGIGSTINIACTVGSAFQINGILINDKTLDQLGAVKTGNTITIEVTPDFINAVNASLAKDVNLDIEFTTGLSNLIMFGGIGGGAALVLLAILTVLLVIRSKHINVKRKAAEAKAREYEQRFNISSVISDLRKE